MKVYRHKNGSFTLENCGKYYTAKISEIATLLVNSGVERDEAVYGLENLIMSNNDVAIWGVNNTFLFSK